MEYKKFELAKYLISSDENKIKFCFICNKDVLYLDFKNHLVSKKHQDRFVLQQKQSESELDFLADSTENDMMKFCKICNKHFSPMYYEIHIFEGKHEI